MAIVKINFKKKNISESGPLQVEIESLEFPTEKGNKKVENIFFCFNGSNREEVKKVLQSKKSDGTEHQLFELEYDEDDLEVEEPNLTASKLNLVSGPAPHGPKPKITHKLAEPTLRIWEFSLVKITVQADTTNQNTAASSGVNTDQPQDSSDKKSGGESGKSSTFGSDNKPKENDTVNQHRDTVISEITTALNQEPKIIDNDLETEYRTWKDQINGLNDTNQINNLKDRVLANIKTKRENKEEVAKTREKIKDSAQKSGEELLNDLKVIDKKEGENSYEENRVDIEKEKKRAATENLENYRKKAEKTLEEKMKDNIVEENEIDQAQRDKLKNAKDSDEIIEAEKNLLKKVGEKGVDKKLNQLKEEVDKVIEDGDESKIKTKKEEILNLLNSNIYWQARKSETEELLKKLESTSTKNNYSPSNDSGFPWRWVAPIAIIGGVFMVGLMIIRSRRKRKIR